MDFNKEEMEKSATRSGLIGQETIDGAIVHLYNAALKCSRYEKKVVT